MIFLAFSLLLSCSKDEEFTSSEELKNGDFSNGMQNWKVKIENGASAKGSVVDGSMMINITNNGSNIWDARLSYTRGIYLKKDVTYRLGFSAWTDSVKSIYPDITGEKNGFEHYAQANIIARKTPNDFFFAFTMKNLDDEKCIIDFDLADDKSSAYFDNITITKLNKPLYDINGEWSFTLYKSTGKMWLKHNPVIIMNEEGLIEFNNDIFSSGYVSGNELEIDYYGYVNLKGTVEDKKITGTYINYIDGTNGTFIATPQDDVIEDISGTYDLAAFYNTPAVNISNETDVFGLIQTGNNLAIASKSDVTGKVTGNIITLNGDILPGAAKGGSQVLNGSINGNNISGFISGTVKVKDINNNISLQTITNGTFTLSKRQ